MKNIKFLSILILVLTLSTISCSKKDSSSKTSKELLTSKKWSQLTFKINGIVEVQDACQSDNYIQFSSDGTYVYNPGTVKCYTGETAQTGTWTLSSDGKTLTVGGGNPVTIAVLTESKMVIKYTDGADNYEETYIPL